MFGGRSLKHRTNDIYALNLNNYVWVKISSGYQPELSVLVGNGLMSDRDGSVCDPSGGVYPEGRSLHTFTRLVSFKYALCLMKQLPNTLSVLINYIN